MKPLLTVLTLFFLIGCSSVEPTRSTPVPSSATSRSSIEPTGPPAPWRVDVVNGPRRIIVSLSPGGLYVVDPNDKVTLLESPDARAGGIEVIEVTNDGCVLLDTAQFSAESFTITLTGDQTGPYTIALERGTTLIGPPTAKRTTDCMG